MKTKLKESLQGVVAVAVLVALFWAVKQHSFGVLAASNGGDPAADSALDSRPVRANNSSHRKRTSRPRPIPADVNNLPACEELAGALRQLHEARAQLLEAFSKPDGDCPTGAQNRYRQAISAVRVELSKVHDLVDPADYAVVCQEVIAGTLSDNTGSAYPWELGGLAEGRSL